MTSVCRQVADVEGEPTSEEPTSEEPGSKSLFQEELLRSIC